MATVLPVKLTLAATVSLALLLSACGSVRTPQQSGGQNAVVGGSAGYKPYQTRDAALGCIRSAGLKAVPVGKDRIKLDQGASVYFAADRGDAAARQARGQAEGAEVLGSAVFYVGSADGNFTSRVESCL